MDDNKLQNELTSRSIINQYKSFTVLKRYLITNPETYLKSGLLTRGKLIN